MTDCTGGAAFVQINGLVLSKNQAIIWSSEIWIWKKIEAVIFL